MAPRLNIPPLTRSLFVSLVAFTFLNATIQPDFTPLSPFTRTGDGSPYLTIIPGISWSYPWTFATAALVEQNIFGLVVTGLTLFFGGRYLERAYGSSEYAKYILFAAVIPNILCFIFYILFYAATGSEKALYVKCVSARYVEHSHANHSSSELPQYPVALPSRQPSLYPSSSSFPNTPSPLREAQSECASSTFPPYSCSPTQHRR